MTTSRRHSNSRRDHRRKSNKIAVKTLTVCSNCGALVLPHRVCRACGYFRGKLLVAQKAKKTEKTAK
jgi:large subunit ribosomal protein L32